MYINNKLEDRLNELESKEQRIAKALLKAIAEGKTSGQLEQLIIDEVDYVLEED